MRDELHRLVLNLIENALRHTDPGTAVEASVERQEGHVVLAVEDDGPGIPRDLRDKVFERFFRGPRRPRRLLRARARDRPGGDKSHQDTVSSSRRWTAAGHASSCGFPRASAVAEPASLLEPS